MKWVTLFCFLLVVTLESYGQRDPNQLLYAQKVQKFRKMKNIGSFLTVTGGILAVSGIATLAKGLNSSNYSATGQSNSNIETGILLFYLGAAGLGTGIPFWIIGAKQQRKYERKFEQIQIGFNLVPQGAGLTFVYRF